jgi:hypothetical protein
MKRLEYLVESTILASRWLLVIFYAGLAVALLIYAGTFALKLFAFISKVLTLGETDTILAMLGLIDAALVASLVVMVIISGYENFVSRFDNREGCGLAEGQGRIHYSRDFLDPPIADFSQCAAIHIDRNHVADDHAYDVRLLRAFPGADRSRHGLGQEGCRTKNARCLAQDGF